MVCYKTKTKPSPQSSVCVSWSTLMNLMKSFSHDILTRYLGETAFRDNYINNSLSQENRGTNMFGPWLFRASVYFGTAMLI